MRTITPEEAKTLREILLEHDAPTLSPGYAAHTKLNLMLDHLRGMLMDIQDQDLQPKDNGIKDIEKLIHAENQKMEAMRATDPSKIGEQLCYVLGLANGIKALEDLIKKEDQKLEAMRETDPDKVGEQFCYVRGLAKALSLIQKDNGSRPLCLQV